MMPAEALTPSRSSLVSQANAIRATSAQNQTLYLNDDRIYSYNMEVLTGTTVNGLSIPAGATLRGRYEPTAQGDGLRYVVYGVEISGQRYSLSAASPVLDDQTDPRDTSVGSVAEDVGIGAAAGAVLGEVTGEIDALEVLGGAAAGGVVGNVTADNVVVIEPNEPITLYPR
ncbi:MAG: hypothetical protein ACFB8W_17650 [Elainellaceae cyanobacterium]